LLCGAVLAFSVYESAGAETIASATDEAAAADAAVRGAGAGIDAAWNAGDAVAFAARWAEDGVVISPMGELTEGRGQIQADMATQFAGPLKATTHKLDIERVYEVRSGVAVADGEAIVRALDGTPWTAHFSAVFERDEAGRWLVRHMTSYVFISR
jgi:uncharacterized protein (TIGR02246 family)